jgi:tyrosyl-DNA phosphodiesterase-1
MVDIGWLLGACPLLRKVPRVVVIHGESGQSLELLQNSKPRDWVLYKPPLRLSYGTHHSKAMLLVYPTGVRVIVHTANLIHVDWNNKSQGLWMQDFPWNTDACKGKKSSVFENDLVEYLTALEVNCKILPKKALSSDYRNCGWVGHDVLFVCNFLSESLLRK